MSRTSGGTHNGRGATPGGVDPQGSDALLAHVHPDLGHVAAVRDDPALVEQAQHDGVDFSRPLTGRGALLGLTAAHIAAHLGHLRALEAMAKLGVPLDEVAPNDTSGAHFWYSHRGLRAVTPLALAVEAGRSETIAWLLARGVSVARARVAGFAGIVNIDDLDRLIAHGLDLAEVAREATPRTAARFAELREREMPIDAGWVVRQLEHIGPWGEANDKELAGALFGAIEVPASGVVRGGGGEGVDLLALCLEHTSIPVVEALLEAGVAVRAVRVPASWRDAKQKKAWLAGLPVAPLAGPTFRELLDLADEDLPTEVVLAHLTGNRMAIGPVRLAMTTADLDAIGFGDTLFESFTSDHLRQHSLELIVDEVVIEAKYVLKVDHATEQRVLGTSPALFPLLTAKLAETLGKPAKKNKRTWRWERDGELLVVTEEFDESEGWTVVVVLLGRST